MDVDDALDVIEYGVYEDRVEARRVLEAGLRQLRDTSPYVPCQCGRKIYFPGVAASVARDEAAAAVVQAWSEPLGTARARLRQNWPALGNALDQLWPALGNALDQLTKEQP